jgi:predicted Fe-Mo cluster-binding NifX family protein
MNVAIPTLANRVSPVFDVAQAIVVVELQADRELHRQTVPLLARDITRRVAELSHYAVNVLICGAISRPLEALVQAAGIHVIPQICGPVEDVLRAFIAGRLDDRAFLMPGCRGRRRRGWRGAQRGRHPRPLQDSAAPSSGQNKDADGPRPNRACG